MGVNVAYSYDKARLYGCIGAAHILVLDEKRAKQRAGRAEYATLSLDEKQKFDKMLFETQQLIESKKGFSHDSQRIDNQTAVHGSR
jgi:hypothetical protein